MENSHIFILMININKVIKKEIKLVNNVINMIVIIDIHVTKMLI